MKNGENENGKMGEMGIEKWGKWGWENGDGKIGKMGMEKQVKQGFKNGENMNGKWRSRDGKMGMEKQGWKSRQDKMKLDTI